VKGGEVAEKKTDGLVRLKELFLSFKIDSIGTEVDACLKRDTSPRTLLSTCQECMEEIGEKFDAGEYYLPELVVAGEMFKEVSQRIQPLLRTDDSTSTGAMVLGTPQGDIHHLGKDIFKVLAKATGFVVHDLGVDVPPQAFLDKLEATGASILGMSALVTAAFEPMREVIRLLDDKGFHKKVRVIIGGGVTTREMADRLGADAQTQDAYEGLKIVRTFVQKGA
jgi:methanogenic corrinoid protein MtbC1